MKLTLQIKLNPSAEQKKLLLDTIVQANDACDRISRVAWEKRIFGRNNLHKETYHLIKDSTDLSAQVVVRQIAKVVDAYKLDKKTKRVFTPMGAISYDSRILTYKWVSVQGEVASIWCIGGRQKMTFTCHRPDLIPYIKGEADLLHRKGKFFLMQVVDIPDKKIIDVDEYIGVDLGITTFTS